MFLGASFMSYGNEMKAPASEVKPSCDSIYEHQKLGQNKM